MVDCSQNLVRSVSTVLLFVLGLSTLCVVCDVLIADVSCWAWSVERVWAWSAEHICVSSSVFYNFSHLRMDFVMVILKFLRCFDEKYFWVDTQFSLLL